MKIKTLLLGNLQTNGYVVSDENHHCLIIDPGANGKKVVHYLTENELVPEAVLLTHGHFMQETIYVFFSAHVQNFFCKHFIFLIRQIFFP